MGILLKSLEDMSFDVSDIAYISGFCLLIAMLYLSVERHVPTLKAKSWIVMLFSSGILSLFGTLYAGKVELYNLWTEEFIYGEDRLSRCVLLFFFATNVMDLFLGMQYYPKQLDPLSSLAHHSFYLAFITVLLGCHYSRGFVICFFMEIPTFILAMGTVLPRFRFDLTFGVSFLLTRLCYNIYLGSNLFHMDRHGVMWKICCGILCLHVFWFYKWVMGYGKKLMGGDGAKQQEEEEQDVGIELDPLLSVA